jgi:hypothetical protein
MDGEGGRGSGVIEGSGREVAQVVEREREGATVTKDDGGNSSQRR